MTEDMVEQLLNVASDALYTHRRVRWVLLEDGRQIVVTDDGDRFELRLDRLDP